MQEPNQRPVARWPVKHSLSASHLPSPISKMMSIEIQMAPLAASTGTLAIQGVSYIHLLLLLEVSSSFLKYHQQEHLPYDQSTGWCNSLVLHRTICDMPHGTLHYITRIHGQQMIPTVAALIQPLNRSRQLVAYLRRLPPERASTLSHRVYIAGV